jgi:hypothetical protein
MRWRRVVCVWTILLGLVPLLLRVVAVRNDAPFDVYEDVTTASSLSHVSYYPLFAALPGDKIPAIYFFCHRPVTTAADCCLAIQAQAATWLLLVDQPGEVVQQACLRLVMPLPTRHNGGPNDMTYVYFYSPEHQLAGGWFPPPVVLNSGEETAEKKQSKREKNESLPGLFPSAIVDESTITGSDDDDGTRVWRACIASSISDTGGMHRDLQVQIQMHSNRSGERFSLSGGNTSTNTMSHMNNSIAMTTATTLDIMVYLPADLFINVEDAIDKVSPSSTVVEILHVSSTSAAATSILNQEEPTFVSPPHAVLFRVHSTAAAGLDDDRDDKLPLLRWTIKVHTRYPTPLSSPHHSFARIVMPPPFLVSGNLVSRPVASDNDADGSGAAVGAHTYPITSHESCPAQALLVLWVAAGRSDDYGMVVGTTLLVALLGTIVMMRDIVLVSKW